MSEVTNEKIRNRYYRASCDNGAMEVTIPELGGKLPVGEDADDLIGVLRLIIRQLERSRDTAAETDICICGHPKGEHTPCGCTASDCDCQEFRPRFVEQPQETGE